MATEPVENEAASPNKRKLPKTLILVLAVAIAEALVFVGIFKFAGGGPEPVHGEGSHVIEGDAASEAVGMAEVQVVRSFRVPNDKSGRMFIYDLDISVVVPADEKERMEQIVEQRSAEFGDRIARIVRGANHRMLGEDDLRALREQLLEGLREIANDQSLIQRVLIPRFVPMPGN